MSRMLCYSVARVEEDAEAPWSRIEKARIASVPWPEYAVTYPAYGQLALRGRELMVRMEAREPMSRAICREDNGPVHRDSCLELFLQPAGSGTEYYNFELNPNGCMKAAVGSDRSDRRFVPAADGYCQFFHIRFWRDAESWGVSFSIALDWLCPDGVPEEMRGNFYKCGDETRMRHYACWNRVESPRPDFHRPESFGRILLPPKSELLTR